MRNGKLLIRNRLIILVFVISLTGLTLGLLSNVVSAVPIIIATKRDTLVVDNDSDNAADLGDVLRYTITVTNSGTTDADNVVFNDTIDPNTTLVIGSLSTTPIARNDSYASLGNVGITVPAGSGVLANDNDPDGQAVSVIPAAGGTANGGAFAIGADGSFSYQSPAGFEGTDSFTYTVQDSDGNQDPATVFIVVNEVIWFIDNSQAGPGTGVMSNPFSSITNFNNIAADEEGDIIFIYETGSGVYTADIPLLNNQTVIGQGASASISSIAGFTVPPFSNALPNTGGSRPVLGNSFIGVRLQANNTLRGFDIGNTPPGGAGIANVPQNVSFGTLTINDMAIGGNGRAILITGDGTLVVTLDSITATADANGLGLLGNTGTIDGALTVTGATTIFNTSNIGINIFNTTAALDFGNTSVTNAPANAINVVNSPSGSFTFDSLTVSSSNGAGLFANNGGTITVTGAGNTASATGGPAVSLTNTTIGPSGITFQSVSANNATNGIVLNNTGSGSFTVTGTGTMDGSGGTIQNITNRGASFINAANISLSNMTFNNIATTNGGTCTSLDNSGCNAAIHLDNASTINLTNVDISTSAQQGINGLNVNGFSLTNSTATACGDEVNEGCLRIVNLSGTASISNSDLSFPAERVAQIANTNVTLNLTVSNSTFRDSQSSGLGADGLEITSNGASNTTIDVMNSNFLRNRTNGLQVFSEDTSFVSADVTGSTFDRGAGVGIGMDLTADGTATLHFNIIGNPLINSQGSNAINVFSDGSATVQGRINDNPNIQAGGSTSSGFGIRAQANTNSNMTLEIDNNTISNIGFDAGIQVLSRLGAGRLDATINNNNVTVDATNSLYDIWVQAQDSNTTCATVTNNTTSGVAIAAFRARTVDMASTVILQGTGATATAVWDNNGNTPTGSVSSSHNGTLTLGGTCNTVSHSPASLAPIAATVSNPDSSLVRTDAEVASPALHPARISDRTPRAPRPQQLAQNVVAADNPASSYAIQSGESVNVALGKLDPGQVVLITFDVTVDSTVLADSPQVCNQGLISGDNFVNVLTSDPDVGVNAPTCTAVEVKLNVFLPYLANDLK